MRYGFGYFEEDHLAGIGDVGLWRRILAYVAPRWKEVAAAVVLSLIVVVSNLALPYLVKVGVDRYIVVQGLPTGERLAGLGVLARLFLVIVTAGFVANFLSVTLLEWTGQNVMHRIRQRLFDHLLGLDLDFFHTVPAGKLVTRLTNDIQNMHEMFTSVIVTLFNDILRIAGILAVLFWMNWRLALIMSLLLPVMIANTVWFSRLARDVSRVIRTSLARINAYLQEAVGGLSVVQLFRREAEAAATFARLNQQYLADNLRQIRIFGIFMPAIEVMQSLAIGLIIWYGGGEIIRNAMSLGVLVAFLTYMRLFFQPLRELSQKYSIVQSAMASAERIFELLDRRSALPLAARPSQPERLSGALSFRRVRFGYEPEQPVLHDLSLEVAPGETVAVVGATGSGKTTLINLLERFYDPQQGAILLDGVDLRRLDPDWLRHQIGLVMQEPFIVPASLRDNILLDRRLDDRQLDRIVAAAQLDELVSHLPEGLDTMIGEGFQQLSSGQAQLLAIARVLARDPRILVLDEATASIDTETEMRLERAVTAALEGRTSIVIAHRLSTIRRADTIVVMDRGRIAEIGRHEELLARHGLYAQLHNGRQMPSPIGDDDKG